MVRHKASFKTPSAGDRHRTYEVLRSLRRIGRISESLAVCSGVALVLTSVLFLAPPAQAVAAAGSDPTTMQLVSQSSWLAPGQSFDLTLQVRSHVATSDLGIALSVYAPPIGQSSFSDALAGDTSDEQLVSDTPTVPFSSLSVSGSRVQLQAPIAAGTSISSSSALALDLECEIGNCNGVYPLRVQLMDTATGAVLVNMITFIIYVESSSISSKLRVGLVVPVGSAPATPTSGGTIASPSHSEVGRLTSLVSKLGNTTTPVTVLTQPETVQALRTGNSASVQVARSIAALSDQPNLELLQSPYVWIDTTTLRLAGLTSQVTAEFTRGRAVLSTSRVHATGNTAIVEGSLDSSTLQALTDDGFDQVIVPSSQLQSVAGRYDGPCVQTFTVSDGRGGGVEAAVTDPSLENELNDVQNAGGALAANQLLADLALISFEEPEAPWVRGVVLEPGYDWSPSAKFLQTLLSGLGSVPVIDPVTMSAFFSQVSHGDDGGNSNNGNGWPSQRQLVSVSASTSRPSPGQRSADSLAKAIIKAQSIVAAFQSVVNGGETTAAQNDVLLSAQSALLSSDQQTAAIEAVEKNLTSRSGVVTLAADRNIRLTAQTATIPITLVKQVSFPVTVEIELSSDKLAFIHGKNPRPVYVTQHTQSVDVEVFARTSGDFPVEITVKSPKGGLVIASAKFTVRSLSSSFVAILLTIGAAAVLLFWWGRTFMKGRRSRKSRPGHGAHVAGRHHDETAQGELTGDTVSHGTS